MEKRVFGSSSVALSPVIFGCMRLDSERVNHAEALALLHQLYDRGVTTFHSSHEYETYPFFCEVLAAFRKEKSGADVQHVCKLGVPHFNEDRFLPARMAQLVDAELQALGTDSIDVVQWLVRHNPNEDVPRLAMLAEQAGEMGEVFSQLKAQGKIRTVAAFPYSPAFAEKVVAYDWCDGLVDYLNPYEQETVHLLDPMAGRGQGFIGIRPYAAGRVFAPEFAEAMTKQGEERSAAEVALSFALSHPNACAAIVSVSSAEHANQLLDAAECCNVDPSFFTNWQRAFAELDGCKTAA